MSKNCCIWTSALSEATGNNEIILGQAWVLAYEHYREEIKKTFRGAWRSGTLLPVPPLTDPPSPQE